MAYGGGHVIEDLIKGKPVLLRASSYGTDCYPNRSIETYITKDSLNQAYLFNPRNAYQNYAAAVNSGDRTLYTYMGTLLPRFGNVTYSSAGELSPLLNDPYLRSIGVGTRIFLGGAQGYVAWEGTQHNPSVPRGDNGVPLGAAGTLALIGDLKKMDTDFIRAARFHNYGTTMFVGVGIPIPILDAEMARFVGIKNEDIYTSIFDYSVPKRSRPSFGQVSYAQLRQGSVQINGREVPTAPLSSLKKAREIAALLKEWIQRGEFLLQEPAAPLPREQKQKPLEIRTEGVVVR